MNVGQYPEPSTSIRTPSAYRMSPRQFWGGLLFTARALRIPVKEVDPRHGRLLLGPIPGPTGVSILGNVTRRRALVEIRTIRISETPLTRGAPPRPLGVTFRTRVILQAAETSPIGALWSDLSTSPLHPQRRRVANKIGRWVEQEILVGETQYWMNHKMTFGKPKHASKPEPVHSGGL